jgi:hypothetical protein
VNGVKCASPLGLSWPERTGIATANKRCRSPAPGSTCTQRMGNRRAAGRHRALGRVVDLSPDLVEVLRRLEVDRKAETLRKGWAAVPEHVFVTERDAALASALVREPIAPRRGERRARES